MVNKGFIPSRARAGGDEGKTRSAYPVALAMAMAAMAVPMADLMAAMVPAMMIPIAVAIVPVLRHRRHAEAGERNRGDRGQFE
jgi:hypothetical protein